MEDATKSVEKMLWMRQIAIKFIVRTKEDYREEQKRYHYWKDRNRRERGKLKYTRELVALKRTTMHKVAEELGYHRENLRMAEWILNNELGHHVQLTKI